MKHYLLLIIFALGLAGTGMAQDDPGQKDGGKLEALKIAFLTRKLNLSSEEAEKFWPIYNRYTDELRSVRREQKDKNLSEIEVEDKVLSIRKKYNGEFSKALSAEKINQLFRSEKEFGTYLQRELQERRMNRQLNKRPLQ